MASGGEERRHVHIPCKSASSTGQRSGRALWAMRGQHSAPSHEQDIFNCGLTWENQVSPIAAINIFSTSLDCRGVNAFLILAMAAAVVRHYRVRCHSRCDSNEGCRAEGWRAGLGRRDPGRLAWALCVRLAHPALCSCVIPAACGIGEKMDGLQRSTKIQRRRLKRSGASPVKHRLRGQHRPRHRQGSLRGEPERRVRRVRSGRLPLGWCIAPRSLCARCRSPR